MSERKNKSIKLPKYDLQSLLSELTRVCDSVKFDGDSLIAYILADWLITLHLASKDDESAFLSFLKSHEHHVEKYREYLKEVQNAQYSQ